MTREDLLQQLFDLMRAIMRQMGRFMMAESALSPPQVRLMFIIGGRMDGVTVTELAEKLEVTPGAISQFVDALVEKGLVTREGDPDDRRLVRLKLSDAARGHYEKLRRDYLASVTRVFGVLSDDELRQLIRIFEKVGASHGHPVKPAESGPVHRHYVHGTF